MCMIWFRHKKYMKDSGNVVDIRNEIRFVFVQIFIVMVT